MDFLKKTTFFKLIPIPNYAYRTKSADVVKLDPKIRNSSSLNIFKRKFLSSVPPVANSTFTL